MSDTVKNESDKIKIRLLREGARVPERVVGSACWDLYLPEDVTINAGETKKVGLGIAMKLPANKFAVVCMRSSAFGCYGLMLTDSGDANTKLDQNLRDLLANKGNLLLTNGVGIIDGNYCGDNDEWILSLYKKRSDGNSITIPAGTRLAQFFLLDTPTGYFEVVDTLGDTDRGGFGSTGK